jgi:TctA family transporter
MIGSGGSVGVFWSNGLVGTITTLAITLLFWPLIDRAFTAVARSWRPTPVTTQIVLVLGWTSA